MKYDIVKSPDFKLECSHNNVRRRECIVCSQSDDAQELAHLESIVKAQGELLQRYRNCADTSSFVYQEEQLSECDAVFDALQQAIKDSGGV